jgi:hypothetical protein
VPAAVKGTSPIPDFIMHYEIELQEKPMNVGKVMEILDQFEVQAIKEIELDNAINTDNFESVGKFKLIGKIRKRIIKEADINNKEAA